LDYLSANPIGVEKEKIKNHIYSIYTDVDNDILRITLRSLEDDGYISTENDICNFRSPLLREYWKRKFL